MFTLKLYMSSTHMAERQDWGWCIRRAAAMGFDGLELFGAEYECAEQMEPDRLNALRREADRAGVALSAHPWIDWGDLPPETLRKRTALLMEHCARLGQRAIILHMDFLAHRRDGLPRLFEALDPICPFLTREGINVMIENVPAHGIDELGSRVEDFDQLFAHYPPAAPVQMNIDIGHAHIMGTFVELAQRHTARWRYTHIDDNAGQEDSHLAPGEGTVDWALVAEQSFRAGYRAPLLMEYPCADVSAGIRVLASAYQGAGYQALHDLHPAP